MRARVRSLTHLSCTHRAPARATDIAERLGLDFGLVHKERKKHEDVEPEVTFVGDVNGRVRKRARAWNTGGVMRGRTNVRVRGVGWVGRVLGWAWLGRGLEWGYPDFHFR